MLLVIHNLPMNTRFGDVKSLLLEKCGLRNLILDKLIVEDNAMKITVGLPTEEDAALLVRKINGLFVKGHQLYVQDLRQKPSEQPYRLPKPAVQQDNWSNNIQPSWDDEQQGWNDNPQQSWNRNPQQSRNNNPQPSWDNNQQQGWNNNPQPSRNNNPQQSWNHPVQKRTNESQGNLHPLLYRQQQNQNVQSGYGQELVAAATMWAQQAQQVNTGYDTQSVHYPQNVQYPQQFSQFDNQGYGGWGQGDQVNQSQGYEQGGGDYTNANTSWGESSVPSSSRGRSQETHQFNDSRRGRPERSFERESRDHSRQRSPPRVERFDRPQAGNKRRWEEEEHRADDWRQRPGSPPRNFRQHHRGRDIGAPQRSGCDSAIEPWADGPNHRFQPSNSRFDASKQRFEAPKPKFEPKPKFNKKQKFNAPNQKFNAPNQKFNTPNQKFNTPNQKFNASKPKFNATDPPNYKPWHKLTEKQQQKIMKRREFNRSKTVTRITREIFNDLGLDQSNEELKIYFTDPVRSRLDKALGDETYMQLDMMYAKYLDAFMDDKQNIYEEAQQLQREGIAPKLQTLFTQPGFVNPKYLPKQVLQEPQAKRFKAEGGQPAPRPVPTKPVSGKIPSYVDGAEGGQPAPRPVPTKPVSGKIPSYVDGDKQRFKAIKQQHLKDMETLRCPEVGPELDAAVSEEVDAIADIFYKVAKNAPDEKQKEFLQERVNEESVDDFKKMFKQKICQRLMNEGAKIVRIYAFTGKPPKKAELEPFMRQFGVLALKKSDRKPFFTAHLDSYTTLDKLCNMGNVKVGNSEVIFKPLHMTPKYKKVHMTSLNKMRNKYVASQIRKPEVNILEKDWETKLAAFKEEEEILKQEKAAQEAAEKEILEQEKAAQEAVKKEKAAQAAVKKEKLKQEKAAQDAARTETDVEAENGETKPENCDVKLETSNLKSENTNLKPENVEPEHSENPNMDVHTDRYGELHANFDVIDEVHGSDTENDPKNNAFYTTDDFNEDEAIGRSDESILREMPVGSDPEIIYDDDDELENDGDQAFADDIDLDNIDENDLEDY